MEDRMDAKEAAMADAAPLRQFFDHFGKAWDERFSTCIWLCAEESGIETGDLPYIDWDVTDLPEPANEDE